MYQRFFHLVFVFFGLTLSPVVLAEVPSVSVLLTATHPALDKVKKGILDGVKDRALVKVYNALGSPSLAVTISNKLKGEKPDVVVAVGTLAAVALQAHDPLVFSTVTDPIGAGLLSDLTHPGKNISGVINKPAFRQIVGMIKKLDLNIKRVGVIINPSEPNSVSSLKELMSLCQKHDLLIEVSHCHQTRDLKQVVRNLLPRVDALVLFQDHMVASGVPLVTQEALASKTPVFSCFEDSVTHGGLMGIAVSEYAIGLKTAEMVIRILDGEKVGDISVLDVQELEYFVNPKTAKSLGIQLPHSFLEKALIR